MGFLRSSLVLSVGAVVGGMNGALVVLLSFVCASGSAGNTQHMWLTLSEVRNSETTGGATDNVQ